MSDALRRTGVIAKKIGMTHVFDEFGEAVPVTILHVAGNIVVDRKTQHKNGYNALVIGYGNAKKSRVKKPQSGLYAKAKVEAKSHLKEFRVAESALLEVGEEIDINHFVIGHVIDVQGLTSGKGFSGVMKRYNFSGLEASHGVSISHRSGGSTGQRQDPGKVFKGKKMAGHMGHTKITMQNLEIVDIDANIGIIAVRGAVPGRKGNILYITDAMKKAIPTNASYPAAVLEK